MTKLSLSRVIGVVLLLALACAHEVREFPERLGEGDEPVVGDGGMKALGSAGSSVGGSVSGAMEPEGGSKAQSSGGKSSSSAVGGKGGAAGAAAAPGMAAGGANGEDEDGTGQGGAAQSGAAQGGSATTGGAAGAGASGAGAPAGGGAPIDACSSAPSWQAGTYEAGDHVQNGVNLYECKPHPYSGWCGLDAYAPGLGWVWTNAWILVGPC